MFQCFIRVVLVSLVHIVILSDEIGANKLPNCYTSTYRLREIFDAERVVIQQFSESPSQETTFDKMIKSYLINTTTIRLLEMQVSNFMHHPINALYFIKRIVHQLTPILVNTSTKNSTPSAVFSKMLPATHDAVECWPTKRDIKEMIRGLVQVIFIYQIPKRPLIRGNIFGHQSVYTLEFADIVNLVEMSYEEDSLVDAVEWCDILMDDYFLKLKRRRMLQLITTVRSKALHGLGLSSDEACNLRDYLSRKPFSESTYQQAFDSEKGHVEDSLGGKYVELCRATFRPANTKLYCHISRPMNGWFPVKREIMSTSPFIAILYDVISGAEIDFVKLASRRGLKPSRVYGDRIPECKTDVPPRVSQSSVMTGELGISMPTLTTLSRRIELMSGLRVLALNKSSPSEVHQVVNYGFAGLYVPHNDYFGEEMSEQASRMDEEHVKGTGDRMATFIYYLSSVGAGGTTVFPHVGVAVPAVRRSAVMWYNLHRNGSHDYRSFHGGCPVLIGSKWISNKWIRERTQLFSRPCSLDHKL